LADVMEDAHSSTMQGVFVSSFVVSDGPSYTLLYRHGGGRGMLVGRPGVHGVTVEREAL